MNKAVVVEIRTGSVAQCSRRILDAFEGKSLQTLEREVARAARICDQTPDSSLGAEQAELLEALLESMHASISRHQPDVNMELSLLGHLAGR